MGIFSEDAVRILRQRYFVKDAAGIVIENSESMLRRVAVAVAAPEEHRAQWEEKFYDLLASLRFLPNSPTLANAGRPNGQLAACFVLPVPDSIEGIFETIKRAALIHKTGGGTGFSFSKIRPKDDAVSTTGGVASGPVPFIKAFNCATDAVKQGGMRRGANMAVLDCRHPDIFEFIRIKELEGALSNFNISVALDDRFMSGLAQNRPIEFINPRNCRVYGESVSSNKLFDTLILAGWRNGEPGILFFDHINSKNTLPGLGPMTATNPCGEQPLFDYESCTLGSLNLPLYVTGNKGQHFRVRIDWKKLKEDIITAVRFLDNVIDINYYLFTEIEHITKANRKIGLGVMGFADLLVELGVPYASDSALGLISELMGFISTTARQASCFIAEEKGSFKNIDKSIFYGQQMRNATVTTIAPTGTLSMLAGVSSGIEPLFGLKFTKEALNGTKFAVTNSKFEETARARGFWSTDLMSEIAEKGSLRGFDGIPEDVRSVFATSFDISPEWHVRVQAAFQSHVDNAVSKTINFPYEATTEHIREAYMLAWKLGCKGLTIYRSGSRESQVISFSGETGVGAEATERCIDCNF